VRLACFFRSGRLVVVGRLVGTQLQKMRQHKIYGYYSRQITVVML
jgi:hypothetical protein